MSILNRNDQSGRSMVEMLGVLAIIGVLSVGGISGYSKAMAKYKLTKAQDQITMLLMNIRTAYATSPSYDGLNSATAAAYNLAPNEMVNGAGSTATLNGTFGGAVNVGTISGSPTYFYIQLTNLGKEACRTLLSSDWGADGMVGIWAAATAAGSSSGATCTAHTTASANVASASWCVHDLPVSIGQAHYACSGEVNSITWVYY